MFVKDLPAVFAIIFAVAAWAIEPLLDDYVPTVALSIVRVVLCLIFVIAGIVFIKNRFRRVEIGFRTPKTNYPVAYWLRFVKSGTDEERPHNIFNLKNKDYKMKLTPPDCDGFRSAKCTLWVPINLGFQFKCYAECDEDKVAELINELQAAFKDGYSKLSIGRPQVTRRGSHETIYLYKTKEGISRKLPFISGEQGKPKRVWFVHPDYNLYLTEKSNPSSPYLNNFYNP